MITARNYAAQAQRGLRDLVSNHAFDLVDQENINWMADTISRAQHFVLPDGGDVLDGSNLKGLDGIEVRLPFQFITVEYFADPGKFDPNAPEPAHKRVVIAQDVTFDEVMELVPGASNAIRDAFRDGGVHVVATVLVEGNWIPLMAGYLVTRDWNTGGGEELQTHYAPENNRPQVRGFPTVMTPSLLKQKIRQHGDGMARRDVIHDIAGEVSAALNLLEALACSNVSTSPVEAVDPRKNARRVAAGKLPIYETKQLVIDANKTHAASVGFVGNHRSPRQHLRRGHIRRLDDNRRIWVNSCVVGHSGIGRIEKVYALA